MLLVRLLRPCRRRGEHQHRRDRRRNHCCFHGRPSVGTRVSGFDPRRARLLVTIDTPTVKRYTPEVEGRRLCQPSSPAGSLFAISFSTTCASAFLVLADQSRWSVKWSASSSARRSG